MQFGCQTGGVFQSGQIGLLGFFGFIEQQSGDDGLSVFFYLYSTS